MMAQKVVCLSALVLSSACVGTSASNHEEDVSVVRGLLQRRLPTAHVNLFELALDTHDQTDAAAATCEGNVRAK